MGFDEELGNVLRFTRDDLEENRRGFLSEPQRRSLRTDLIIVPATLLFILVVLLVALMMAWGPALTLGVHILLIVVACLIGSGVVIAVTGLSYVRNKQQTLHDNRVQSATVCVQSIRAPVGKMPGAISTDAGIFRTGARYFRVPYQDKTYRFYYIKPDILLSAEEVQPDI